jgi:hypothetical protein
LDSIRSAENRAESSGKHTCHNGQLRRYCLCEESSLEWRALATNQFADIPEVHVFGRRSYARFTLEPSSAGVLSVLRDVVVQEIGGDEVLVVGREPAAVGDVLTLELTDTSLDSRVNVRVVECRPVVIDGATRHRLRLQRTHGSLDSRRRDD